MKALVLNSGGVDSTTAVGLAISKYGNKNVSTVSINYGQKHNIELECAKKVANYYDVNHYELNLSEIFKFNSTCSLLSKNNIEVEKKSYEEQLQETNNKPIATSVPFRNGLFVAAISSLAMSIYPDEEVEVYLGIHQDDSGSAYPDCSPNFNNAMRQAVEFGTANLIHLVSPFVNFKKKDIVKLGIDLKVPYELTFSCYDPVDGKACGLCGTCRDRLEAFRLNNIKDPIEYQQIRK